MTHEPGTIALTVEDLTQGLITRLQGLAFVHIAKNEDGTLRIYADRGAEDRQIPIEST